MITWTQQFIIFETLVVRNILRSAFLLQAYIKSKTTFTVLVSRNFSNHTKSSKLHILIEGINKNNDCNTDLTGEYLIKHFILVV